MTQCSICGKAGPNVHTCNMCGANVCPMHYDKEKRMCTKCSATRGGRT